MPEARKEPAEDVIGKKERKFSPSQSDSEREIGPRDQRAEGPDDGGEYTSELSSKRPYPQELENKLEKLQIVKRIPILKEPRIVDLVAKFKDFP